MTQSNISRILPGSFPPRVRFNWGFHDATADAEDKRARQVDPKHDPVYAAGYRFGLRDYHRQGRRAEHSDHGWMVFVASGELERMFAKTTESIRRELADAAYLAYDFVGNVGGADGWETTSLAYDRWSRTVYVEAEGDFPSTRLTFVALFHGDHTISEVYALDHKGQIWGNPGGACPTPDIRKPAVSGVLTVSEAKDLVDCAVQAVGGTRGEWSAECGDQPAEVCLVALPDVDSHVRVGVSSAGMVSVDGDACVPNSDWANSDAGGAIVALAAYRLGRLPLLPKALLRAPSMDDACRDLEVAFGDEHPAFTRGFHAESLATRDTRVTSYWEWVVHQIEASGLTVDTALELQRRRVN